jgi:hypothetical protein
MKDLSKLCGDCPSFPTIEEASPLLQDMAKLHRLVQLHSPEDKF